MARWPMTRDGSSASSATRVARGTRSFRCTACSSRRDTTARAAREQALGTTGGACAGPARRMQPSNVERRRARYLAGEALRCDQAIACGNQFRDLFPVGSRMGRADAYPALGPDVGGDEERVALGKEGLSL